MLRNVLSCSPWRHLHVRFWLTVGMIVALYSIPYSRRILICEPIGHLRGIRYLQKDCGVVEMLIEIGIRRGDFGFDPDRDWKKEDVLNARVMRLRIVDFSNRKK
ncbi:MAG: hypothetical protein C0467_14530 [Planctomycetaceae bacterium]|nr:hypothetical protein [Planctomycetaceae bacterium]